MQTCHIMRTEHLAIITCYSKADFSLPFAFVFLNLADGWNVRCHVSKALKNQPIHYGISAGKAMQRRNTTNPNSAAVMEVLLKLLEVVIVAICINNMKCKH